MIVFIHHKDATPFNEVQVSLPDSYCDLSSVALQRMAWRTGATPLGSDTLFINMSVDAQGASLAQLLNNCVARSDNTTALPIPCPDPSSAIQGETYTPALPFLSRYQCPTRLPQRFTLRFSRGDDYGACDFTELAIWLLIS